MNKKIIIVSVSIVILIFLYINISVYFSNKKVPTIENETTYSPVQEQNTSDSTQESSNTIESEKSLKIKNAPKLDAVFYDAQPIVFQDILFTSNPNLFLSDMKFYSIGKVVSGEFKDAEVILLTARPEGPSMYDSFIYLLKFGNNYEFLALNSDFSFKNEYDTDNPNYFKSNVTEIKDLALDIVLPTIIKDSEGSEYKKDEYVNLFFNPDGLSVAFVDKTLGNVYYKKSSTKLENTTIYDRGGFYVKGKGGILSVYEALYPSKVGSSEKNVPNITLFDKNITLDSNYKYVDFGGCGARNYVSLPDVKESELNIVGKVNSDDSDIYTFKDLNHPILKDLYQIGAQEYTIDGPKPKLSYDEYIKKFPVFFWKDKFGRLIKFQNEIFVPLAECGKPVIYLYPKKTTDVRVEVAPKGGFTKTIPKYNQGWDVVATPESVITDKSSGLNYPYLFWEGRGGIYETPTQGFVVEKENVEKFLNEKLEKLGLIKKERDDFIEFWLPKMQEAPFYFVTFLGNREIDNLAPLNISPKPDSIIRILMDFKPLEEKINVESYEIRTPKRTGFTVVEWGGVLR